MDYPKLAIVISQAYAIAGTVTSSTVLFGTGIAWAAGALVLIWLERAAA